MSTWTSITFGNGRFVAVANSSNGVHSPGVATSLDGIHWVAVPGTVSMWHAVAFGAGQFVMVGDNGTVMTSSNGSDWSMTFRRPRDNFTGVSYGNGRFVAVDNVHGDTIDSTNAHQWAFYLTPSSGLIWGSVAYGDGNFVAFDGSGTGTMATTVKAAVWALRHYGSPQQFSDAAFGCHTYVGVGDSQGSSAQLALSSQGVTWSSTSLPLGGAESWSSVAFGTHRFVVSDGQGDLASSSFMTNCGPTVPFAVQHISGLERSGMVWTYQHPPLFAGGAPVTSYLITISDGLSTHTCSAPQYYEPNCKIFGLRNHHVYSVWTQAKNRFGLSVPSDAEFVIPVPSGPLHVQALQPVVLTSNSPEIQLSGVVSDSEGIFPHSTVVVHIGERTMTCFPNPFGECLFHVADLTPGPLTLWASYVGYGVSYTSVPTRVAVASVSVPSSVTQGVPFSVSFLGGIRNSVARVQIGAATYSALLDANGAGHVSATAPATSGSFSASISDAGIPLQTALLTAHA